MRVCRLLLSLPLRRHTVVAVLVLVTILFIIYQFNFVAELGQTGSKAQQAQRNAHDPEASNRKHPRDISLRDHGKVRVIPQNKNEAAEGEKEKGSEGKFKNRGHSQKQDSTPSAKPAQPSQSKDKGLTFKCEMSGREISVSKVNDNYCDCPEDGSDEPKTNACMNGRFTCLKHAKSFPESIPSGWVNDGVCDCCDGSDEWKMRKSVQDLALNLQRKIGRYLSPCPDQCPEKV